MKDTRAYAAHQMSMYRAGAQGEKPALPLRIEELEQYARERISPEAYDYIAGGAGSESTMRFNLEAFDQWRIVPRMMRDVEHRDLGVELFGTRLPAPLCLAPIGVQTIVHEEGELAVARAARTMQIPLVHSSAATKSLEDVAEASGDGARWFQLYWPNNRDVTRSFVQRAETAGYSVLVVTLDTRMLAWRERDLQHAYLPFFDGEGLGVYLSDPVFRAQLKRPPEQDLAGAVTAWAEGFSDLRHTWDDIAFLRECTSMPIVLKGIMHPDDAIEGLEQGLDGIIVSNHGGRQVDGGMAALDALPQIVEAVKDRIPVLFDSGIRRGADILKALSLGAKAVLLGRPYMWGLAAAGQEGVQEVLRRMLADFDITMAMSGYSSVHELSRDALTRQSGV